MRKVSYRICKKYTYKIIRRDYGFVLINLNLNSHSHLDNWFACKLCMKFIEEDIEPKKAYLKEAVRRLTTPDQNGSGIHESEKYIEEKEREEKITYKKKPKKFKYKNNYKKLLTKNK